MSDPQNPYAAPQASIAQPGDISADTPLATRWVRLAGALIDGLILIPIIVVLVLILFPIMGEIDPNSLGFSLLSAILGLAVYVGINYKFLLEGQTIGKRLMRTRMVDLNNQLVPVPLLIGKRIIPIWLAGMLPFIGGFVGLVNAVLIFRADRRCGHDLIAGTKVVQVGADRLAGVVPGGGSSSDGQAGVNQPTATAASGPASAGDAQWYYAKDGSQAGPVDQATLAAMVRSGEIKPDDLVWREGMGEWQPAAQVPELG